MPPWPTWRVNPAGVVRSLEEALAIAKDAGIDVDRLRVTLDDNLRQSDRTLGEQKWCASYLELQGIGADTEIEWSDHVADDGTPSVRLNPLVLSSDEAIIWVLAHEVSETDLLEEMFNENAGRIMGRVLYRLIDVPDGTLHIKACESADLVLARHRKKSP